jgi:hypothetical protein
MSKKNILSKEKKDDQSVHVTFQNDDGTRTYQYRGAAARGILRGKDPAAFTGGKLILFQPKEKV